MDEGRDRLSRASVERGDRRRDRCDGVARLASPSRPLAQDHMRGRASAGGGLHALVAERAQVEAVEQLLAAAEEDGRDDEVQVVDQARLQELPDRRDASAKTDVLPLRRFTRLLQRRFDPVRDETEFGAALHDEGCARMVSQNECRHVIRRLLTPPPFPLLFWAWTPPA